jgi:hypothetical protein
MGLILLFVFHLFIQNSKKRLLKAIFKANNNRIRNNQDKTRENQNSQVHCVQCMVAGTDKDVQIQAASLQTKTAEEMYSKVGGLLCLNCVNDYTQATKATQRSIHFNSIFNSMSCLPAPEFKIMSFNINELADGQLHSSYFPVLPSSIRIRLVYLPAHQIKNTNVDGAYLFSPISSLINNIKQRVISNTDEYDATLLVFTSSANSRFLFLANINLPSETLTSHAREQIPHLNLVSKRSGSSGSFVFSDSDCKSRSRITKQNGTILVAPPHSAGMSVVYNNQRVITRGIYNDIPNMRRMSKGQKIKEVVKSKHYCNILIREMVSRLTYLLVAHRLGLLENQETFHKLNQIASGNQSSELVHNFTELSLSKTESNLLAYACGTGEMTNFSALGAHCDSNKSHEVETLAYNLRVHPGTELSNTIQPINKNHCAYLLCCYTGIMIEVQIGKHIIHCNLKNIMHCPDESRNHSNYSRAAGPS